MKHFLVYNENDCFKEFNILYKIILKCIDLLQICEFKIFYKE